MPHKGKLFPYLFPRDLYPPRFNLWGWALRYKCNTTGPWAGSATTNWAGHALLSDEGVWDYSDGTIIWNFPNPTGTNPTTSLRIIWTLTGLQSFGELKMQFRVGSVVHVQALPSTNLWSSRQTFLGGTYFGTVSGSVVAVVTFTGVDAALWSDIPP